MVLQNRFEEAEAAHQIITGGPEPLQSQFSTGFGMVLNLLQTRTQEEAKAFIQRSFSNYLGVSHFLASARYKKSQHGTAVIRVVSSFGATLWREKSLHPAVVAADWIIRTAFSFAHDEDDAVHD